MGGIDTNTDGDGEEQENSNYRPPFMRSAPGGQTIYLTPRHERTRETIPHQLEIGTMGTLLSGFGREEAPPVATWNHP